MSEEREFEFMEEETAPEEILSETEEIPAGEPVPAEEAEAVPEEAPEAEEAEPAAEEAAGEEAPAEQEPEAEEFPAEEEIPAEETAEEVPVVEEAPAEEGIPAEEEEGLPEEAELAGAVLAAEAADVLAEDAPTAEEAEAEEAFEEEAPAGEETPAEEGPEAGEEAADEEGLPAEEEDALPEEAEMAGAVLAAEAADVLSEDAPAVEETGNAGETAEDAPEDAVPAEAAVAAGAAAAAAGTPEGKKIGRKMGDGEKKAKKNKNKKNKLRWWQVLLRLIIIGICAGIIGGSVAVVAATMYLTDVTADDNKVLDLDQLKLSFATAVMVFDDEKGEWYQYERLYSDENRVWVNYTDMPEHLIKAAVASEDKGFWTNSGVDWKRTAFAFINEYIHRMADNTQGGSTITQQLIKNLTNEDAVAGKSGALRKLREIYRALELTKNYSKEQIMEAYLNTIRLSGSVAGIEAGANYYFGKTTKDLTLAESAAILCITKFPTANNPYLYPEENMKQRGYILYNMLDYGLITQEEYEAAREESHNMVFDPANMASSTSSTVFSYFTDAVIDEVLKDLEEIKGLSHSEALNLIYTGGLTIYTTMDPKVQDAVEATAFDTALWPKLEYDSEGNPKANQIEAAIVIMNYEGEVKGIAGGIREKTASRSLNRATSSPRQPGSSFKPVSCYAPAVELKKIYYSSLFPDTAAETINGVKWPKNWSGAYGPPVTVYEAMARSLNTVAVHTMKLIGPDFSFDFLTTSLGYTTLVDERWSEEQGIKLTDRGLSMCLGGLTDGVTVLEHTAAYAVFGNGGVYHSPHFYTMVCDRTGDVILDKTKYVTTSYALSEQTAYIMNQMMRGVVREGTTTRIRFGSMPISAKSGTSSNDNDFWCMGLTPYYVGGVWMGYDENGKMSPYSLHYDAQVAWKNIMQTIHEGLPYKDFPKCDGVVAASFCMDSGDLATSACHNVRTGYYTPDNMPGYCNHGYLTIVDEDED